MIKIYMNESPIDVKLEEEQTIGDVLKSFEQTCEENQATVIGITINNEQITADKFDEISSKPLTDDLCFNFTVVSVSMIKDAFLQLSDLFNTLSDKMAQVPVDLQSGKNNEVSIAIKEVADSIDELCHFASLATLFPETFKEAMIEGHSFKDFFTDFSPILLDFEQAMQNNDTVLIGDLSEYEICPRLKAISDALKTM
ncbi:MAG: hypothetical protein MJ174_04370 [Treponema sp.]|nr:hypothetical protein [Treponema sp.]